MQVSSSVQSSPARITLSWPQDTNGVPWNYTVYRKAPSETSWGGGTSLSGSATSYTDTNVSSGVAYEYRIVKASGGYTGYGYIQTAIQAPLVDNRGKLLLVVDNSVTSPLAAELARLESDLAGDGWTVSRIEVSRSDSASNVKNLIRNAYNADSTNVKAVFLFGHVPVPYSGQLNPDGHPDHAGAWPADAYYGDMDGNWTDNSVYYIQSINTQAPDAARLSNTPGDGKFDQTVLPSAVELMVGRVDLSNLPGRKVWAGPATFPSEVELLRKYLNKDHNFRHRISNYPRRAVVGDYFGARGGEAFSASAYRSYAPLVGASNIRNLNVEFNDQQGVWVPQLAANDYLFAYGCGAGSYASMSGLGSGLYNGADTLEVVTRNVRGVFNLVFGSWLGDWDTEDNIMRAMLITDTGLVSAWSGRPHWFMHPLGLGEPVGYAARLTQNNKGLYEHQINAAANYVHIALMGDPTLRIHPVVPVGSLNGSASGATVNLNWSGSGDSAIVGYHVYRSWSANGPYTRLTGSPISALNFTDNSAPSGSVYMVRAIKLEDTTSGSYYNPSQGVFWSMTGGGDSAPRPTPDTTAPSVAIATPTANATVAGASVTISANANDNIAIAAVQLRLDGTNLGGELTSAPYNTTLNTTTLANGTHTLSAIARDTAGNIANASTVTITVNNTPVNGGGSSGGGSSAGGSGTGSLSGLTLWFDDALPTGAGSGATGGDSWSWITSNPTPISGSKAHQSTFAWGLHEHSFNWGTPMNVGTGDILVTYVYLDPANMPTEIMLSWCSNNWEHRAYWGADKINYGTKGTASRYYAGALPAGGQWVRLEVPASAVGLEGQAVQGMGFSTFDGRATYDATGKAAAGSGSGSPSNPPPPTGGVDTVWFDDALPTGASGSGSGGDTWSWVTSNPAPVSGSKAHQSTFAWGLHEHAFNWGTPMTVPAGSKLFTYVYLDPANMPTEIMLSWCSNNWEHRAYWGADKINYGTKGTASRYYAGALPAGGQWVRLEVPASAVGLEGHSVQGMGFSTFDGRVTYDKTGQSTGAGSSTGGGSSTPTLPAGTESVWYDDALPAGASGAYWDWTATTPAPVSGTRAVQSSSWGLHERSFNWATTTMSVGVGESLFVYVYLDPANPPSEIMLSWCSDTWEHRAYWGADQINYGNKGTAGRFYAGGLPATGQWVRLEVPASAVGLEGHTVRAMGVSIYGGKVTQDKTGKITR